MVTQTSFVDQTQKEEWSSLGATSVEEFSVPPTYTTPAGSLFKARNLCYWQSRGVVGHSLDEERAWILAMDEECLVTEQLVGSLVQRILAADQSAFGYAMPPALQLPLNSFVNCFWVILFSLIVARQNGSMQRG